MSARTWILVVGVLLALLVSSIVPVAEAAETSAPSAGAPADASARPGVMADLTVTDGATASYPLGGGLFATLQDTPSDGAATLHGRTYWIGLSANGEYPAVSVRLITTPVPNWGFPDQLPGGVDNLPTLSLWQWSVWHAGVNDTANWTENVGLGTITRQTSVGPDGFEVVGTSAPVLPVQVFSGAPSGARPTQAGVFLQGPGLQGGLSVLSDSDYRGLAAPLGLGVLRVGVASIGTQASWNSVTQSPRFNFTGFDAAANLSRSLGSRLFVSLPVGTWGDGNVLPAGMPVDPTLVVPFSAATGYFPTQASYVSYLDALLNHTTATGETVAYWNVGNEMPLVNETIVERYIALFNLAARTIHAVAPGALVGSDVMTNTTYQSDFSTLARGVGYLSFHYYPAAGLCVANGTYCAPGNGPGTGIPDANLFRSGASITHLNFNPPFDAASLWFNATGQWLPVLVSESNLNGAGGNPANAAIGSDPRQQSLFASSWLVSTLMNATVQNVSAYVYFTLTGAPLVNNSITGPLGGWGFGLTTEGTADNDTRYAPYWALSLWASASPVGSTPLTVSTDPTGVVGSIATRNATVVHVLLVNRVALPVTVPVQVLGVNTTVSSVSVLDNRSYILNTNPTTHVEQLVHSSVANLPNPSNVVLLGAYGLALVTEQVNATPTGNGSGGNGSGNNSQGNNSQGNNSNGNTTSGNGTGTNTSTNQSGGLGNNTTGASTGTGPTGSTPAGRAHSSRPGPQGTGTVGAEQGQLGPGSSALSHLASPNVGAGAAIGALAAFGCVAVWRWTPEPTRVTRPASLARGRTPVSAKGRAAVQPSGNLRVSARAPVRTR